MKVKIIYATEVGTTKYVAELLQKELVAANHPTDLHQLGTNGFSPKLEGYDVLLFGSPTYYDGLPQTNMSRYISEFAGTLQPYKIGIFSLGDSGYAHFCGSADVLESWVADNQGKLVVPTLKIDGYPKQIEPLAAWIKQLLATG